MTDKDLIKLLASLKHRPELGGEFSAEDSARVWQRVSHGLGWIEISAQKKYTFQDYLDYILHEARHVFLRPVAAVGAAFGLVLGGWITTVSASNSRPGDILYPVKLASERFQLSLADSPGERVTLDTQFAEQRLQEAVDIATTGDQADEGQVQTAVDGFKDDLNSAHGELANLQTSAPSQVADAASALATNANTFATILSQSATNTTGAVQADVASAQQTAQTVQAQAVTTLVTTYEATPQPSSAIDLQNNFREQYQDASSRLVLALGNVAVIRSAAQNLPAGEGTTYLTFASTTQSQLLPLQKNLNTSMDIMAAGGYKTAFQLLSETSQILSTVEPAIANEKITLSTVPRDDQP